MDLVGFGRQQGAEKSGGERKPAREPPQGEPTLAVFRACRAVATAKAVPSGRSLGEGRKQGGGEAKAGKSRRGGPFASSPRGAERTAGDSSVKASDQLTWKVMVFQPGAHCGVYLLPRDNWVLEKSFP